MIEILPNWINLLFIATSVATIVFFHYANSKPWRLTLVILGWSVVQSILAYIGFYENGESYPPRFALALLPPIFLIIYSLLSNQSNWFLTQRNLKISTFLHVVRLPVEIVLLQLFLYGMIPELMTFEGRNFDIIAGITAPIIGLLFLKNKLNIKVLLLWNVLCLLLVTAILINGVLSAELPFQQFGFEQPNRAVIHFPFILLPATIVPIVIWTHITDIILLLQKKTDHSIEE